MGGSRLAYVLVALVALVGRAAPAWADDDVPEEAPPEAPAEVAKDPKAARKAFTSGQQLVRKGDAATRAKKPDDAKAHYEGAVTAFEQAIAAGEEPSHHLELGAVLEKLGRDDLAANHYRTAIKAGGAVAKKATARFDDVTSKIGLVTLVVDPAGTTIAIAGKQVGQAPLEEPLAMLPGDYTIALAAEGHEPREVEIKVEPGSESERTYTLEPTKVIVDPVKPPPPVTRQIAERAPSKLPMVVGGGVAVALVGVATITGILAVGEHGTFEAAGSTPAERADAKDSGERLALITDLCIVGAVASGGFAAYWYFAKYRPARRASITERNATRRTRTPPAMAAKVEVVPWVKADAGGFVLAGSF